MTITSPVRWEVLLLAGGLAAWLGWEAVVERRRTRRRATRSRRADQPGASD